MGRREFTLIESESVPRGLLGWHTVPRGHRDSRRSTSCPTCLLRPPFAALARPGRAGEAGHLGRGVAGAVYRAGQFFVQVEAAPGREPAELERRITGILHELASRADGAGAGPGATPARGGLAMGAGGPRRPGGGHRPCRALGRLADWQAEHRPPWPWTPTPSAGSPPLPDRGESHGRLVAPRPRPRSAAEPC